MLRLLSLSTHATDIVSASLSARASLVVTGLATVIVVCRFRLVFVTAAHQPAAGAVKAYTHERAMRQMLGS